MSTKKPKTQKVVILGGGIGGINALREISHLENVSVTLIDPNLFHICKPALHSVAAGTLTSKENSFSFAELAKKFKFEFLQATAEAHDAQKRELQLSTGKIISYDWLIVACGAVPNDFYTEGAQQYCRFLNNTADARIIYDDVRTGVQTAYQRQNPFSVIIIGGGPTGVQLTAELYKSFGHQEASRARSPLTLNLIEGSPRLLASFNENISKKVTKRFADMGVHVQTSAIVSKITEKGIFLKDGTYMEADLIIWAAGVKPHPALKKIFPDLEYGRNGGLAVTKTLQTTKNPRILAVGDCAFLVESPLPPTAQVARKEGMYLSKIGLPALFSGKKPPAFVYRNHGSIVVLSRYGAWGELPSGKSYGGHGLEKFYALFLHELLFIRQQYELGGACFVLRKWLRRQFS